MTGTMAHMHSPHSTEGRVRLSPAAPQGEATVHDTCLDHLEDWEEVWSQKLSKVTEPASGMRKFSALRMDVQEAKKL
jgi:hypothetical protein